MKLNIRNIHVYLPSFFSSRLFQSPECKMYFYHSIDLDFVYCWLSSTGQSKAAGMRYKTIKLGNCKWYKNNNSDSDSDNDNKGSSKSDNNIRIDDASNLVAAHEFSFSRPLATVVSRFSSQPNRTAVSIERIFFSSKYIHLIILYPAYVLTQMISGDDYRCQRSELFISPAFSWAVVLI